jgi:hypothetical protein
MEGWVNVGVKFGREYETIITDLALAIGEMEGCSELLEMDDDQWAQLDDVERSECLRTLADDVFYGLGTEPVLPLGEGVITYDKNKHTIQVKYDGKKIIRLVHLI